VDLGLAGEITAGESQAPRHNDIETLLPTDCGIAAEQKPLPEKSIANQRPRAANWKNHREWPPEAGFASYL